MRNKLLAALFSGSMILSQAFGASAASGTDVITDITIEGGNFARIALASTSGSRPACHNSTYTVHYGFDISTSKGRAMLATAQAALLGGKRVSAIGAGSCTNIGAVTIETLSIMTIWP